jgi:hypothetical protein
MLAMLAPGEEVVLAAAYISSWAGDDRRAAVWGPRGPPGAHRPRCARRSRRCRRPLGPPRRPGQPVLCRCLLQTGAGAVAHRAGAASSSTRPGRPPADPPSPARRRAAVPTPVTSTASWRAARPTHCCRAHGPDRRRRGRDGVRMTATTSPLLPLLASVDARLAATGAVRQDDVDSPCPTWWLDDGRLPAPSSPAASGWDRAPRPAKLVVDVAGSEEHRRRGRAAPPRALCGGRRRQRPVPSVPGRLRGGERPTSGRRRRTARPHLSTLRRYASAAYEPCWVPSPGQVAARGFRPARS